MTTIALPCPPILWRVCSRKCSTMISAFWARLWGCRETKRAMARRALRGVVLGVVRDRLLDLPVRLVGRVVGEHVEDEALLDGLAHRVEVERARSCRRGSSARTARASGPWGRGEGEERQVRLASTGRHGRRQGVLRVRRHVRRLRAFRSLELRLGGCRAEGGLQVLGGLAGLGGVRLVHDDREAALPEVGDLVEDERELLEGRDDDPALLAGQGRRELGAVLVDPRDDAASRARTGRSSPGAGGRGSPGR